MDVIGLIGALLGVAIILTGNVLEGGSFSALLNLPALVIVAGGTLAACLVQTPFPVLCRAWKLSAWLLKPPVLRPSQTIEKILTWSEVARREGLGALERFVEDEADYLSRKALGLLSSGFDPQVIRSTLNSDLDILEYRALQAAKVFDTMGGYAPTMGIMGAVLGLIQVMSSLDDPGRIGSGIATAFVATLYGIGLANLILLPAANKLKSRVYDFIQLNALLIEGSFCIAQGQNTRIIQLKLQSLPSQEVALNASDISRRKG